MQVKIPQPVRFLFMTYVCGMCFFTALRLLFFLLNIHLTDEIPVAYIFKAFGFGLLFDTTINCYLLSLPFILFIVFALLRVRKKYSSAIFPALVLIVYAGAFLILCADIPWFKHEQTRFSNAAFQWIDNPAMMLGFIFQDRYNYPFLILFLFLCWMFYVCLRKVNAKTLKRENRDPRIQTSIFFYCLTAALIVIGIRGRLSKKSPIRWGITFISQHNFTNQLGLNPVFTLLQSMLDEKDLKSPVEYMETAKALQMVSEFYGTEESRNSYSPVVRQVHAQGTARKYNIVLVLMESMTAYNMSSFGNKENLTPVLDNLFQSSLSYSNFYSDGIHTFCGIYSSLFGMPSNPNQHHLKDFRHQQEHGGLGHTLNSLGYKTIFFTTHDDQFDNMGGFLASNGFDKIISQKDYDAKKVLNVLGIPDHILFEEVVIRLNREVNKHQPFFATILTGSNHGPYEVPEGISLRPHSADVKNQIIEYADWSIGTFLDACRKQSWFDSTIFIFTGDHGAIIGDMDKYLTFHHVPLIIYAPQIVTPLIDSRLGGQVDIYPTVMGLLNHSYRNNSFGIDLRESYRTMISFSYDDEYGSFSRGDFYVFRKYNPALFQINREAYHCQQQDNPLKADSLLNFARSIFQAHQWMIENRRLE